MSEDKRMSGGSNTSSRLDRPHHPVLPAETIDPRTSALERLQMNDPSFTDSPNAYSKSVTVADGPNTHGKLNQHPSHSNYFNVGVTEERGSRRTMEDAHSFVIDFAGVRGQGYFAIFDGHAGKHAAEWCGAHFHERLLEALNEHPDSAIPEVFNRAFHAVDSHLSKLGAEDKTHSGCTAVTAFLRIEDEKGSQNFITSPLTPTDALQQQQQDSQVAAAESPTSSVATDDSPATSPHKKTSRSGGGSRIRNAVTNLATKIRSNSGKVATPTSASFSPAAPFEPPEDRDLKRVLYTGNAGDARAVISRGGKAVRLTYDHKGSDKQEAKRITDAGGFVMNNRVNGVLAVTRSLGDSSMKEFVVGSPYTTETVLDEYDEFLILACDGLWDVAEDQQAVDLVRQIQDPQEASQTLVKHALANFSSDNITVLVVRFKPLPQKQ